MPLPTFAIIGAQKCGTSSLAATLREHPEVAMARPKELHFFDRHFERGTDWYEQQFRPRPAVRQWGEATPAYLYETEARHALTDTLPDARFVVILRDPVKRAYSHFWHQRRRGSETSATFEEGVAREPERLASLDRGGRRRFAYLDRGRYVDQLEDLVARHGRERVHVLLLDDLARDRVPTLEAVFGFLDVDPARAATIEEKWTNRGRLTPERPGNQAAAKPAEPAYPPIDPATRARLVEHFRADTERLATWLGRDLSAWLEA